MTNVKKKRNGKETNKGEMRICVRHGGRRLVGRQTGMQDQMKTEKEVGGRRRTTW